MKRSILATVTVLLKVSATGASAVEVVAAGDIATNSDSGTLTPTSCWRSRPVTC